MSQYQCELPNSRRLLYGLDLPTGGYFYAESYGAGELFGDVEVIEDIREAYSLTLSALLEELGKHFSMLLESSRVEELVTDFVGNRASFGAFTSLKEDLVENFTEYLKM